jgi:uncharacterized protein
MRAGRNSWLFGFGAGVLGFALVLLTPAQAQFWSPFGGPRRPPAPVQSYAPNQNFGNYNPFGGFFGPPQPEQRREAPPDNSHAPSPQPRKADIPAPTTSIVVMGDAMADWLAYGLEDAYSERPEIGIVRKHRTGSGLIRYDTKRDVDWAQTAREVIAAEKPKFVVMMIGTNDHQVIRERAQPAPAKPAAGTVGKPGTPAPAAPATDTTPAPTEDAANQDAESPPDQPAEPSRNAPSPTGTFEFHTDQWEAAYIKRIDATIAALKSGGVPVLWVGLPAQRGSKATSDNSYLNELYRSRAERAGIIYVDIWDGFVDEQGRFAQQGPDFEGQTRRLRSADGIYFTKAGARKLAHYVEREVDRNMGNRPLPMPLPSTVELSPPGAKPGTSSRPLAGPVVPLTASVSSGANEELLGGARPAPKPAAADPIATRVLTKGEAISPPTGRADDFSWPRGGAATVTNEPIAQTPVVAAPAAPAPAAPPKPAKPAATASAQATGTASTATAQLDGAPDDKPKARKPAQQQAAPRPAPFRPFATIPNIFR